jgi:hypothetical protein
LLLADLPNQALPTSAQRPLIQRVDCVHIDAPPTGMHAIFDAVAIEPGRYLLALGDTGAAIVDSHGKITPRFEVPAYRLIRAHSGQMALALAKRGDVWRVSRLNLGLRIAEDLGVLEFEFCAPEFDGIAWTVASGKRIRVLDVSTSLDKVLWHVGDLPGRVISFSSALHTEQLLIASDKGEIQLWKYSLPQRRLFARDLVPSIKESEGLILNPGGGAYKFAVGEDDFKLNISMFSTMFHAERSIPIPFENVLALQKIYINDVMLISFIENKDAALEIWMHGLQDLRARVCVNWPSGTEASLKFSGQSWLGFDHDGRFLVIDSQTGAVNTLMIH